MRHSRPEIYFALVAGATALGILIAAAKAPLRASETVAAETDAPRCVAPPDLARLQLPLKRTARHTRPPGINGYRDLHCRGERLDHWNDPPSLLFFGNRLVPRPCGLAANIEDVSALLLDFLPVRDCLLPVEILPAIGKRIRRDVKNTHDGRPLT